MAVWPNRKRENDGGAGLRCRLKILKQQRRTVGTKVPEGTDQVAVNMNENESVEND